MSYPGPSFRPTSATQAAPPQSQEALREWLSLCDNITRAGGRIFVLDPPEAGGAAPDPSLVYTARIGTLFGQAGGGAQFLLSELGASVAPTLERAGLQLRRSAGSFGGQGDVISLGRNRFILTYKDEAGRKALADARALLPPSARVMELGLREGVQSGSECICAFTSSAMHTVLLLFAEGIVDCSIEAVQSFAGDKIDVVPLGAEDGHGGACGTLAVRGTLILRTGLSSFIRGVLVRHGFHLLEMDLPVLYQGCGGPSGLACELAGFVVSDDAPTYALRREDLHRLLPRYPEAPGQAG